MKVMTSHVVAGKIELETDLEEGTPVAIFAVEGSEFHLSADDEQELVDALQDIRNGKYEDGRELLRELRNLPAR